MTLNEQFCSEVEDYLNVSGIDATTFGKRAMKDPRFVFDLRKGRSPSARTMDRVRAFMAAHRPPLDERKQAFADLRKNAAPGEERRFLAASAAHADIAEEDLLRANWYGLLGRLLAREPDAELLRDLAGLQGDQSPFGSTLSDLAQAARAAKPEAVRQEYFDLFIGVGGGELVPYGSYYLAGFLHEKPLARLRGDMARLGIARETGVSESEDHIAALCEMMAGLITGRFGAPASLAGQNRFFQDHIGCWAPRFFEDLEAAPPAVFYNPLGSLGRQFMAVEIQAFDMAA
jgi:TorA maturation chaperone TorD